MNILVIGNGFDLAHDLPTKYENFLDFCERINRIYSYVEGGSVPNYKQEYILDIEINKEILDILSKAVDNRKINREDATWENKYTTNNTVLDEFHSYIYNNTWLTYFLECRSTMGKNWIDFESEISEVIKSIDNDMGTTGGLRLTLEDKIQRMTNKFLQQRYSDWFGKRTYRELRGILLNDLSNLIRAFEIYLAEYIEKIDITNISPDIKEIVKCSGTMRGVKQMLYTNVISFNYTNTYEKIYLNEKSVMYREWIDYIHGKANVNNTIESNNMVLGIDEYLGKKKRNKYVEFIAFKKFYQRIYKQTSCKYKNWIDTIRKSSENSNVLAYDNKDYFKDKFHNLFFFGHSLDITDKDVLKDLILNDNVYTTIFYHNKDTMGQQVANLVKVIGQDELIRKTGKSTKTIEFKLQQDMVPIENSSL